MQGPSSILNLHRWRRTHWAWHLVLAVLMLWGQVAVARHSLQHLRQADPDAIHTVCVQCLSLHAMDHAGTAPTPTAVVLPVSNQLAPALQVVTVAPRRAPAPYLSRAPPALSA